MGSKAIEKMVKARNPTASRLEPHVECQNCMLDFKPPLAFALEEPSLLGHLTRSPESCQVSGSFRSAGRPRLSWCF